ncbi:hypothetical protein [Acinetobacter sp. GSS19]|uniref:hypothetical protein n=1 Tax=Acinetobacter sp. GSS19 TaxID=3020716 RepID=UPI0023623CA1|nr:hypothetical protein [Acinetobacter sp. GSS19]
MDLFEELNQENNKYISVSDAFKLLVEQTNNSIPDISRYLLLENFHSTAQTFLKNYLDKIITVDHQENNGSWHITYDILENCLGENKFLGNTPNRYLEADFENYCWLKSDFFEFEAIKKLGITDINNNTTTQDLNIGNSTITSTEPHIQNLIDKIKELENIIQEKNAKIEELTQLINAIEKNNNIDQLHTKTKNAVAKLILVLSDMANIDMSKPYAVYDAINTKAQLLAIDRFPNDDTVAAWLKAAQKYKETDS